MRAVKLPQLCTLRPNTNLPVHAEPNYGRPSAVYVPEPDWHGLGRRRRNRGGGRIKANARLPRELLYGGFTVLRRHRRRFRRGPGDRYERLQMCAAPRGRFQHLHRGRRTENLTSQRELPAYLHPHASPGSRCWTARCRGDRFTRLLNALVQVIRTFSDRGECVRAKLLFSS